jgi:hypothetical protein
MPSKNIQAEIDRKITKEIFKYHFPEATPDYWTAISIEDWQWHNPVTGEVIPISAAIGRLIADLSGVQELTGLDATAAMNQFTSWFNNASERELNTAKVVPEKHADIRLPLPLQIMDMHGVKYDPKPLLPTASALEGLGAAINLKGLGDAPGQYFRGFTGLSPNEFDTILFDRPEFKMHELNFRLSPKSPQEAAMAHKIYVVLNNAMSPGLAWNNFMFKFPMVINVTLMPEPGKLMKFKPAVINNISTNFTPTGKKAFYHDNRPESMIISMKLTEIEYWINRDPMNDLDSEDYGTVTGTSYAGLGQTASGTIKFTG